MQRLGVVVVVRQAMLGVQHSVSKFTRLMQGQVLQEASARLQHQLQAIAGVGVTEEGA